MKKIQALMLAFTMLVTAAFIPAPAVLAAGGDPNDRMYLEGTRLTAYKAGYGYNLSDMNGDLVSELFVTGPSGKYLKLSVYRYNKKTGGVTALATVKNVTAMWKHESGDVFVAAHNTPGDTYIRYSFDGKKLGKKAVYKTKKVKVSGKTKTRYYKNSKVIKAATYKKAVRRIKKYDRFITRSAGTPWIDSNIAGFAEIAGDRGVANDAHLSLNYDFLSINHLEDGSGSAGPAIDANDNLYAHLGNVIRGKEGRGEAAANLSRYYKKKADWTTRDKQGMKPLEPYLEDIEAIDSLSELTEYLADSHKLTLFSMFTIIPMVDSSDPDHYCMILAPNGSMYDMVVDVGESVLIRCGYSNKVRQRMVDNASEIENALREVPEDLENPEDTELSEDYDDFSSLPYETVVSRFKAFPLGRILSGFGFTGGRVLPIDKNFLNNLDAIYTSDNLQKLKDYIMLYTAAVASDRLDSQEYEYSRRMEGYIVEGTGDEYTFPEDEETRMQEAEDGIIYGLEDPYLQPALQNAYVETYVSSSEKAVLEDYVERLKAAYRKMLLDEQWLSSETRAKAVEKLDAMTITSLYPDVLPDLSYLEIKSTDSYLDAYARTRIGTIKNYAKACGSKFVRGSWRWDLEFEFATAMLNAFYRPDTNEAFICAGYLELMDDLSTISREEMDGFLGFVIGHEITHGFDSTGAYFDKYGRSAVTDDNPYGWWTEEDSKAFEKKVDRVAKYYDNVVALPDIRLYGYGYSGETIADMGGLKLVLQMAKDRSGYDYDKLFRAYASGIFCVQRSATLEAMLSEDEHPLGYLRTNVVVQQFDEFFETYGIAEGDGMYLAPEDRITVW